MKNPLYNEFASEYASAIKGNAFNANFERPSFISMLPDLKMKTILDLGCGPGENFKYFLKEKCSHITAIDLSQAMLDIVKERYGSNVKVYRQNLNTGLPIEKDSAYDLVVSSLAIHYIKNLKYLFKEVSRVLKKKGYFIFSIHHPFLDMKYSNSGNYFDTELLTQKWGTIGEPVEVSFYRRPLSAISNALTESGFHITSMSEGRATNKFKSISEEEFKTVTTKPFFLFLKCCKI